MSDTPEIPPANPWLRELAGVDPHGNAETWTVKFRRLTAGDMVAAAALDDPKLSPAQQMAGVVDLGRKLIDEITRDGESREIEDVPFEIVVECFELHPTFQQRPAGQG